MVTCGGTEQGMRGFSMTFCPSKMGTAPEGVNKGGAILDAMMSCLGVADNIAQTAVGPHMRSLLGAGHMVRVHHKVPGLPRAAWMTMKPYPH